jgi:mono/diheme cytochrome c family protein
MRRDGLRRIASLVGLAVLVAGCQPAASGGAGEPAYATTADTIAFGRATILSHGCGDCHGGGDNPNADNFLVGYRAGTIDTVFDFAFKIPTPMGAFQVRPRNLTPDNETGLGRFSERQIYNALKFGVRPGETPDVEITSNTPGQGNFPEAPKFLAPPMPWPAWRHMTDRELWAIAAYLKRGLKPQMNKVEPSEGPPDFWSAFYNQVFPVGPTFTTPAFPTAREAAPPQ